MSEISSNQSFLFRSRKNDGKADEDKSFVLKAFEGIVKAGLAVWGRRSGGQLRLLNGETFVLDEAGIRRVCSWRSNVTSIANVIHSARKNTASQSSAFFSRHFLIA